MRCVRAQQWMTAAVDGELDARRQQALERHLGTCAACREEMARTEHLLRAVATIPGEAEVPAQLGQATLRRVRLLAAEEAEGAAAPAWWRTFRLPAVAIASAMALALAVGLGRQPDGPPDQAPARGDVARAPAAAAPGAAGERLAARPPVTTGAVARPAVEALPAEPPAVLVKAPELFIDLPILRNMEKLEHFDAITDAATGNGGRERSSG